MSEKISNKESVEALKAIFEISVLSTKLLKDGAQVSDLAGFFKAFQEDPALKKCLLDGFDGISKIKDEAKDYSVDEIVEMAALMLQYIPKILDAIKKD